MSTLIVGCGYLGQRVGERLARSGRRVLGTVRSHHRAQRIAALGIEPIILDVMDRQSLGALPAADRVLYCVGFDRSSEVSMREVYIEGLNNVLERLPRSVSRVVYAGSTSVHGQTEGEWVDEESTANPVHESGRICLDAETRVRMWGDQNEIPVVVLRFAGLYGPDRIVRRGILERGEPIPADPGKFLNLIHIDDAAQAAAAALEAKAPGQVYIASDNRPVLRSEYYTLVARLLGAPAPRFEVPEPRTEQAARDGANRRLSSRRIQAELGVVLTYPDITTGVRAALAASGPSPSGGSHQSAGAGSM